MSRYLMTVLAVLAVVFSSVGLASAEFYSIVDVGVPSGFTASYGYGKGLNSDGDVAITSGATTNAFLKSGTTWTNLGVLNATKNYAYARYINDSGNIAGASRFSSSNNYTHAFLWTKSTAVMQDLGTLGGNNSVGHGLNASGVVAGYSEGITGNSNTHAFTWTSPGGFVDLGTLAGADSTFTYKSAAYAINDNGQVVGSSTGGTTPANEEAFRYSGGTMTGLGFLGTGTFSRSYGINADGDVVGTSRTSTSTSITHGFLWTETGGMVDLGYLTGGTEYCDAQDINSSGQIVGIVKNSSNAYRAAIYSGTPGSGEWIDLNTLIDPDLGWTLTHAYDINDAGQILGHGTIGGATHAFVLTIPEPSTLALLAAGLTGLLAYAWRKRK